MRGGATFQTLLKQIPGPLQLLSSLSSPTPERRSGPGSKI